MKRLICTLLLLALPFSLSACAKRSYSNEASLEDLGNAALEALALKQDYGIADEDYLEDFFSPPSYVLESRILMSSNGNDLNEIGIYRVTEGNANAMKRILNGYLVDSLRAYEDWYNSYIPKELPKLVNAEVKVFGSYVVYAILSDADRAAAFDAIENALLNK